MISWHVQYRPLPTEEDDDYSSTGRRQYDPQFDYKPKTNNLCAGRTNVQTNYFKPSMKHC